MQTIELPVAPFSRRILMAEYGTEPLSLTKGDLLYQALRVEPRRIKSALNDLKNTLHSSIHVLLGNEISRQLVCNELAFSKIGIHIYKIHLLQLFTHVNALARGGVEVKRAIIDFYDKYGITDDDLGLDTAYRYYHREELKKKRKKLTKSSGNTSTKDNIIPLAITRQSRTVVSRAIIHDFTQKYSTWASTSLTREKKNSRISPKKIEMVSILTLRHINGLTFREIARELGTTPSNIIQRNRRAMTLIKQQPKICELYRHALESNAVECPFFLR
jgi:hypothetical protein